MKDTVWCWNCTEDIAIPKEIAQNYMEFEAGATIGVIKCPKCGKYNAISFYVSIIYQRERATEEEIKDWVEE